MQECLEDLDLRKYVPGDEIIVALVKIQLLADEAQSSVVQNPGAPPRAPPWVFRNGLIQRLEFIRDNLSPHARASSKLALLSKS